MEKLYYSVDEKKLFWIVGYAKCDNHDNLIQKIKDLQELAVKFSLVAKCDVEEVMTFRNIHPSRYQYMRVLYVKTENMPREAKEIIGHSMMEWIRY